MGGGGSKSGVSKSGGSRSGKPNARFEGFYWGSDITPRMEALNRLHTTEPLVLFPGSRVLLGETNGEVQAYVVITPTQTLEMDPDFTAKGGIRGRRGQFITSLVGNTAEYSGLGIALLTRLFFEERPNFWLLHVERTNAPAIGLYHRFGFRVVGDWKEFHIMKRKQD